MKIQKVLLVIVLCLISYSSFSQTARVKGIVLDDNNIPVDDVNIVSGNTVTTSNKSGFYSINVVANKDIEITFTHVSLKRVKASFHLKPNEDFEFNVVLNEKSEQMGELIITSKNRKRMLGITTIEPEVIRRIPGANAGIENILKTLPGVNSNNELSTQYAVRGGNFDENLVYVNEVEIYRPFLIRSGQQEGLSFTNTDLVQNVDFSAGGFQAKYGDKLSSVLDIKYRNPTKFGAAAEASLLGGSFAVDAVSKNQKWSSITGVRYRDNSLLVNSQQTQTNFRPTFFDIQTNTIYNASTKWQFSFLGNLSNNNYNYQPLSRQTNFGTIDEPIALQVAYEGQEKDKYRTLFGAVKSVFKSNENFTLKLITSAYHTLEQEYFDIYAGYFLGEVDANLGSENFGKVTFNRAVGTQLNHARNDLDALIANIELKGIHDFKKQQLEWGIKYTREDIRDRMVEWEVIDSAGFSLNNPKILPIKDEPYNVFVGPLVPYQNVRALNYTVINRFSSYAQWNRKFDFKGHDISINAGLRAHHWKVSDQKLNGRDAIEFSPRAQIAIKPNWDKDMIFRLATGVYVQPPSYRELRDATGTVKPNVEAQKSYHFVLSNDYSFKMWNRPFKLVSEVYYKSINDVNHYTLDNVRIRYVADNNTKAYAQGLDLRLNGEFVPGTESWLSFGYLKTEENIDNKGYIARPSDQRLKFGVLFQDYMPNLPSVKVYLNLVYNTGLPGGSPSYADVYTYQNRLKDYRRVDVGFSKVLTDGNQLRPEGHWLKKFKELSIGLEIYNMFNNLNAITNTWVRDVYTKNQYGIPNYMTTRVFNFKITARL